MEDAERQKLESQKKGLESNRYLCGALCVFLASPAAVQITGDVIEHDGGMHLIG